MKLKAGKDEYPMPAHSMICSVFHEVPGSTVPMLQIKLKELNDLRGKHPTPVGRPLYFAVNSRTGNIQIYPAPAVEGTEMKIAYLPPMMEI